MSFSVFPKLLGEIDSPSDSPPYSPPYSSSFSRNTTTFFPGWNYDVSPSYSPPYSPSYSRNTTTFFPGWNYDVFLSFRGEDTRTKFTDHLHSALVRKGFCTFIDDKGLERGEIIDQNLLQAIEKSRNFIIIFSKNYANSESCLNELVKIMECRGRGRKALPIFYHVDPSEVEKQSGKYGEAFAVYENNADLEREQIQKWRTALTKAGDRAGYHIENQ